MGVSSLKCIVFLFCSVAVCKLFLIKKNAHSIILDTDGDHTKTALLPNTKVCGPFTEEKVVGGESADLKDFPWIALLEYNLGKRLKCLCNALLMFDCS